MAATSPLPSRTQQGPISSSVLGPLVSTRTKATHRPSGRLLWNAMKEGLLGDTLHSVHRGASSRRPVFMLHAGLDLSRNRLDVCLLSEHGELVEEFAVPSDDDGVARACAPGLGARRAGARSDRVDDRRAFRPRHARAARLGCADRRRAEGQGSGAVGVQDRQDRRARLGGALGARPGASDLAARPGGARASASRPASGCTWSSTARCSSTASTRR